jgi:hypothetical protein
MEKVYSMILVGDVCNAVVFVTGNVCVIQSVVASSMCQPDRILRFSTLRPASVTKQTVSVDDNFLSTNLQVESSPGKILQCEVWCLKSDIV